MALVLCVDPSQFPTTVGGMPRDARQTRLRNVVPFFRMNVSQEILRLHNIVFRGRSTNAIVRDICPTNDLIIGFFLQHHKLAQKVWRRLRDLASLPPLKITAVDGVLVAP